MVITRSRYLTDGLELDKAFPGKEKGSPPDLLNLHDRTFIKS